MNSPFFSKKDLFKNVNSAKSAADAFKQLSEQSKNLDSKNLDSKNLDSKNLDSKKSTNIILFAIPGTIILFFLGWIYGVFSYGYVGSIMWKWFIVGSFDLPVLRWLQMAGLFFYSQIFYNRCHFIEIFR